MPHYVHGIRLVRSMSGQRFTIGRAGDITLYDDTVSRRHAVLEIEGDVIRLRDLDSRNGTYKIIDKKLVPFANGEVYADEVFAFGECVRSVKQLLSETGGAYSRLEETSVWFGADDDDSLRATQAGFSLPSRQRLTRDDIVGMLGQIDDRVEAGGDLSEVCQDLGITRQRYERWNREYGAAGGDQRLQQENDYLRDRVAGLESQYDVVKAERDAMKAALNAHGIEFDSEHFGASTDELRIAEIGSDTLP